jgi:hypothetical protein
MTVHTRLNNVRFVENFHGLPGKGFWWIASSGIFNERDFYGSVKHHLHRIDYVACILPSRGAK